MRRKRILKLLHLLSTGLFISGAGYITVLALLQAGRGWWFIVSLSGYSLPLIFFLTSLYLFALYHTFTKSQENSVEHPLTSSYYYLVFYDLVPFLGAIGGLIGALDSGVLSQHLMIISMGAFWSTFAVWVIADPVVGCAEMLLPASRKHREERLAQARQAREARELERQELFEEIQKSQTGNYAVWSGIFKEDIDRLCAIMAGFQGSGDVDDKQTAAIGLKAWRTGGIDCMKWMHDKAIEKYKQKYEGSYCEDYISFWWDGIGGWKSQWLEDNLAVY